MKKRIRFLPWVTDVLRREGLFHALAGVAGTSILGSGASVHGVFGVSSITGNSLVVSLARTTVTGQTWIVAGFDH